MRRVTAAAIVYSLKASFEHSRCGVFRLGYIHPIVWAGLPASMPARC
ncbi:MAG: hypothetical protein U0Z44_12120 [Kouleothrix sp.]